MRFYCEEMLLKRLLISLAVWAGLACAGFAQTQYAYASKPMFAVRPCADPATVNGSPKISIWCEFEPYESVRKYLPSLAKRDIDLFLHVSPNDIGNTELASLLRDAKRLGVEVFAWLLLTYDEHLYVGEWTIVPVRKLALDFASWAKREELGVSWIIFDCEPAPEIGRNMYELVRKVSVRGLANYIRDQKNVEQFASSVRQLNALIDELHAEGFQVMGSCNRVVLDGLRYGNVTWQDALNIPFSMVHWDRVSFITYRYHASRRYYLAMVRRYAALSARFFGDRAGLDVGLIGDNTQIPENLERMKIFGGGDHFLSYLDGIQSPQEMAAVIAVAQDAGVRHVNLYALDGVFHSSASLEEWLDCPNMRIDLDYEIGPTPVGSVKAGLTGFLLNSLFRVFVRQDAHPTLPTLVTSPETGEKFKRALRSFRGAGR